MGFMKALSAVGAPFGVGAMVAKEVFGGKKKKAEPQQVTNNYYGQPQQPQGMPAQAGQSPLGVAKNGNIGGALQSTQGGKSYLGQ